MKGVMLEASLLSADPAAYGLAVQAAQQGGVDAIHFDVMDGRFVPNITFGLPVLKALKPLTALPFHVHLMIVEPERYLADFVSAGADILTVHAEVSPHLHRTLSAIRALGARAGVALNPSTPVSALDYVLDQCDYVLVMTVNPGFGGQQFIRSQLTKIRQLRALIDAQSLPTVLGVDGGIDATTAPLAVAAGATALGAGSSLYNARPMAENAVVLRRAIGG
jgi:ribulose-phosphate 3-epimerase